MKRLLSCGWMAIAAAAWFASPAMADPPHSPLTGEVLTSSGGPTQVNCEQGGDFSFTAAGTASGPYPGTFIENGTGTVDVPFVSAFSASLTIYANDGTVVTATTMLGPGASQGCQDTLGDTAVEVPATYQAKIDTRKQTYSDEGTTTYGELFTNSSGSAIYEKFTSALTGLKHDRP